VPHGSRQPRGNIAAAACAGPWLPAFAAADEDRSAPGEDPAPKVYLVAARQKAHVAQSLRSAGVHAFETAASRRPER